MKIRPVGAELFYVYKQTDMTKLLIAVAFRNFADAPKNENSRTCNIWGRLFFPSLNEYSGIFKKVN